MKLPNHRHRIGDFGEYRFASECFLRGIPVWQPMMSNEEGHDFLAGQDKLKVQVKCSNALQKNGAYQTATGNRDKYDILAFHIVPTQEWYLIRSNDTPGNIAITPNGKYKPYQDAWHLFFPTYTIS